MAVLTIGGCATDDLWLRYGGGVAALLINDSGMTLTVLLRDCGSAEDDGCDTAALRVMCE